MIVEPALLNSTPALVGAVIGGGASLAAAVYTQWYQDRRQRIAREADKREAIYGEFIMSASKVLVSAYISDKLSWTGDEQHLIGLINRMRLFAPPHIIAEAEDVHRRCWRREDRHPCFRAVHLGREPQGCQLPRQWPVLPLE